MIGMMYLVLTAMLALNVSADILNGFALVDNSLRSSISAANNRNAKLYRDFQAANAENPEKIQEWYNKAVELQQRADSLYNYLQHFKETLATLADGKEKVEARRAAEGDPTIHIEKIDNIDVGGQYAITQGHGAELKEVVAYYRDFAAEMAGRDEELRNTILKSFATERGYNAHRKDSCEWEVAVFEFMPLGATNIILTKMMNDVRSTEGQLLQYLEDQTDAGDLRVNKLSAYVIPNSNYVIRGGKYSAQIILAGVDSTRRPEYYIEGQRINDQGKYEVPATSVGLKKYSGWIAYLDPASGTMQNLQFHSEYNVSEPAVTISNVDLNVMYRGYDNKFSISVPGISADKIRVNVTGATARQQGDMWIIKPNDVQKVSISVLAELDGKLQPMGTQEFRIKPTPTPQAYLKFKEYEYNGEKAIPRNTLLDPSSTIIASYGAEGLLDIPFQVTSFKAYILGNTSESRSNKFTDDQIRRLKNLKSGQSVTIMDIKAKSPTGISKTLPSITLFLN